MTHYERLGVAERATATEIRDAYRRLARRHHPDRGGRDATAMAAINEAYRVLGEPARRCVYDAALRGTTTTTVGGSSAARSSSAVSGARYPTMTRPSLDPTPARYPWKLVIGMAAVGATVVLIGAALFEPAAVPPPDNLLESGSCVVIEGNGDAREVNCTGQDDLVVDVLAPIDGRCPTGTAGHRDRQGRGLACVAPLP